MQNDQNQINNISFYSVYIPYNGPPSLLHDTMSNMVSYAFLENEELYTFALNSNYTLLTSINSFFSYRLINNFATYFYRSYTNKHTVTLYGNILLFSNDQYHLYPFQLMQQINSLNSLLT